MDKTTTHQPSALVMTETRPLPSRNPTLWIGVGLLVLATLLYAVTLDNGLRPGELEGGDLITHHYAQVQARPSNAPGYPLYTMGGWLWFHTIRSGLQGVGIDVPNPIPILSSYSTLWALLALGLLYLTLCHLTRTPARPDGDGWLAGVLCAFYGVTYFFWYYATTTEQYSSAIAQTLAIVYLYLRWQARTEVSPASPVRQTTGRTDPSLLVIALALLCGLSLAHMLTVAFIVPPLVAVMLWQTPQMLRSWRVVTGAVIAALLPLVSYLYVYWRGMAHPEWWGNGVWTTPQAWFWAFVSTAQGREELGWGMGAACPVLANGFPELIGQELFWPIVVLGVVGIAWLEKRLATLLYGTLVIYLAFCWAYRCGNWFQVILPVYPLLLLGVAALVHTGRQRLRWGRAWYVTAMTLLVASVIWRFTLSLPMANSHNRATDSAFDQAARLLTQPLPPNAPLFAAVQDALALQYLSAIWQIQPDVRVVDSRAAAQLLQAKQPVYSTWEAAATLRAELPTDIAVIQQAVDPDWIAFLPSAITLDVTPTVEIAHRATPEITLQGYTLAHAPHSPLATYRPEIAAATDGVVLTLFWQLQQEHWPEGLSISVRALHGEQTLTDGQGAPLQLDRQQPADGHYPLAPGTLILDPYHLLIPADVLAHVDTIQVLLYRPQDGNFENLADIRLPVPLE